MSDKIRDRLPAPAPRVSDADNMLVGLIAAASSMREICEIATSNKHDPKKALAAIASIASTALVWLPTPEPESDAEKRVH